MSLQLPGQHPTLVPQQGTPSTQQVPSHSPDTVELEMDLLD
jgi:hypothetical protein